MRYFTLLCNKNYREILDRFTSVINAFFADYGINSDMWMHSGSCWGKLHWELIVETNDVLNLVYFVLQPNIQAIIAVSYLSKNRIEVSAWSTP